MPPTPRSPYNGTRRGLVIAIDFGTTFSGVSYALLEPGEVPQVRSVNGFRGQEDQASSTKVPSILYCDQRGKVRARGAEIGDPEISFLAQEEEWTKVEWLKILFRPNNQSLIDAPTPVLPNGKTPVSLLGDYLNYLVNSTRDYIGATHANGQALWTELAKSVIYVLSHPNGWDGSQQTHLRNAAIQGKLIPATENGRSRIRFVSEGEASFHWCVDSGVASGSLSVGSNIIVADAGGGTIDVTAFRVTSSAPLQIEETKPAESRLAGSVFVTKAFHKYANLKLRDSAFGDSETIERLVEEFDRRTKRLFRDAGRNCFVPFGTPRDHEPAFHIRSGQLIIPGHEVEKFFEDSCAAVSDAIRVQLDPQSSTTVFMVGGFAASPWLYSEVQSRLSDCQVVIKRAESHTAKAVAEGAISFFLDHYVAARVAKFTYGVYSSPQFDTNDPGHILRKRHQYIDPHSSHIYIPGAFSTHVSKGTAVKESSVHRVKFHHALSSRTAYRCTMDLVCYSGSNYTIRWVDEDPEHFRTLCRFTAKIPASCCQISTSENGLEYWRVKFFAVVTFGTTEFKCHVEWMENGELKQGPATAVWDEG